MTPWFTDSSPPRAKNRFFLQKSCRAKNRRFHIGRFHGASCDFLAQKTCFLWFFCQLFRFLLFMIVYFLWLRGPRWSVAETMWVWMEAIWAHVRRLKSLGAREINLHSRRVGTSTMLLQHLYNSSTPQQCNAKIISCSMHETAWTAARRSRQSQLPKGWRCQCCQGVPPGRSAVGSGSSHHLTGLCSSPPDRLSTTQNFLVMFRNTVKSKFFRGFLMCNWCWRQRFFGQLMSPPDFWRNLPEDRKNHFVLKIM